MKRGQRAGFLNLARQILDPWSAWDRYAAQRNLYLSFRQLGFPHEEASRLMQGD